MKSGWRAIVATITEIVNAIEPAQMVVQQDYEFHEYANLFPLIEGGEFDDLVADVATHGVREPVWLYQGKILDGRNRHRAARAAGISYETKYYTGPDPLAFVVSLNLKRRHLSESQRAMVAARLANMPLGGATYRSANLQTDAPQVSQSKAAEMLNVAPRSVATAKQVQATATPELAAAVEEGKVSVSAAAQATRFMDADAQRQAVADGNLAKAAAEHRRAEAKLKEVERVVAEAPTFTEEEAARIKAMMGAPGDDDIYGRISEVVQLISEQPDANSAARRVPASLAHAIAVAEIHKSAQWLLDFCTAWTAREAGMMEAA
jgi:hypothetical protein